MATANQAAAAILRSFSAYGFQAVSSSEQLESAAQLIGWLRGMDGWDVSELNAAAVRDALLASLKAGAR